MKPRIGRVRGLRNGGGGEGSIVVNFGDPSADRDVFAKLHLRALLSRRQQQRTTRGGGLLDSCEKASEAFFDLLLTRPRLRTVGKNAIMYQRSCTHHHHRRRRHHQQQQWQRRDIKQKHTTREPSLTP